MYYERTHANMNKNQLSAWHYFSILQSMYALYNFDVEVRMREIAAQGTSDPTKSFKSYLPALGENSAKFVADRK